MISSFTVRLAIVIVAAAVGLAGCGSPGFKAKDGAKGTLRYAMGTDLTTLDPAKVQDVDTMDLLVNVFECLVSYSEKNELVGQLAESWKVSQDGTTWEFTLRPLAKFHNGRKVSAEDVKWSLERACSKELASPTAKDYLSDIVGVKEFGKGDAQSISGIRVIDSSHVEFKLDKARAYFLGKLTYPCASILCKEAIGAKPLTSKEQAVGTGPFVFDRLVPTQLASLKRFTDYYLGQAKLDTIERPIILDAATRLNKYRGGQLDTLVLQRQDLAGIRKDTTLSTQIHFIDRPAVFYLGLNQGKVPVLRNELVRRALAMAIDRKKIATELLDDLPVARGLISPGVMGYRPEYAGIPYDPAQARKLLAEAGYPEGKGFPEISISYREQAPDTRIAVEAIESQLRTNLGIAIKPQMLQWGTLLTARNKDELSMYMGSWFADYADPQNFISFLFTSDSKLNHDGFSDPAFDQICREADSSLDPAKRKALYEKAENLLVDKAVRIPLYFGRDAELISPRVTGIRMNILGVMPHLKTVVQ